jgi:hypothetical protein
VVVENEDAAVMEYRWYINQMSKYGGHLFTSSQSEQFLSPEQISGLS